MTSTLRKLALTATVAGAAALATAPAVFASGAHLSPANTVITGSLVGPANSNCTNSGQICLYLAATVDSLPLQTTCTGLLASGKTPAAGLTVKLSKPPTFSGCTDNFGGTDTVKTSGTWKLVANSTGTQIKLVIPVKGASFTSSAVGGCTIIAAPTKATSIAGSYDNVNTWSIKTASFAASGNGCSVTGSKATAAATVKFTPNVSVVP